MNPVIFHKDARNEIFDAAEYYERQQPGLAARFVSVAFACAERIPKRAWLPPLKSEKIPGVVFAEFPRTWPYRLIVLVESERFFILAVAHDRRRQGYWRYRLDG